MSLASPTARPRPERLSLQRRRAGGWRSARRRATPAHSADVRTEAEGWTGDGPIDFARVFDTASSPCLLLTPDFVICGANQAYLRATCRTLDQLKGRFMFDAFPDNPDDPTADGVANLRASLERALATRRPDTMALQKYDIEVDQGDGVRFEERYWAPVNVPVLDDQGHVVLLVHRVEDVTELMQYRAGRPSEQDMDQYRLLAEQQVDGAARSRAIRSEEALLRSEKPSDHQIAEALQTALQPHSVRSAGFAEVATRYLPVRPGLRVCGDWYDVADLGGGAMGVVVGDVVGHGLGAAAVMAQLRGAAAALCADRRPATAMRVLERRARWVDGALSATVFVAVVDTSTGVLTYCNAGQVPPLLVRPDRSIVELDDARSPVLCAVDGDVGRPEVTVAFDPGSLLVAFTDGLVERRGEDLSHGYRRLRRAVETPVADLDQWAGSILETALGGRVRADDITMVLVRSRPS